jgi:hypothetical protein
MPADEGEAAVRTVVDTARLVPSATIFGTILATISPEVDAAKGVGNDQKRSRHR